MLTPTHSFLSVHLRDGDGDGDDGGDGDCDDGGVGYDIRDGDASDGAHHHRH